MRAVDCFGFLDMELSPRLLQRPIPAAFPIIGARMKVRLLPLPVSPRGWRAGYFPELIEPFPPLRRSCPLKQSADGNPISGHAAIDFGKQRFHPSASVGHSRSAHARDHATLSKMDEITAIGPQHGRCMDINAGMSGSIKQPSTAKTLRLPPSCNSNRADRCLPAKAGQASLAGLTIRSCAPRRPVFLRPVVPFAKSCSKARRR